MLLGFAMTFKRNGNRHFPLRRNFLLEVNRKYEVWQAPKSQSSHLWNKKCLHVAQGCKKRLKMLEVRSVLGRAWPWVCGVTSFTPWWFHNWAPPSGILALCMLLIICYYTCHPPLGSKWKCFPWEKNITLSYIWTSKLQGKKQLNHSRLFSSLFFLLDHATDYLWMTVIHLNLFSFYLRVCQLQME